VTPGQAAGLDVLRALDSKHFPTTREKRPGWEVCDHDSMTWPCDTQKALDAFEPWYSAIVGAVTGVAGIPLDTDCARYRARVLEELRAAA
jgi:hypothetical protein